MSASKLKYTATVCHCDAKQRSDHEHEIHGARPYWHVNGAADRIGALADVKASLQVKAEVSAPYEGSVLLATTSHLQIHRAFAGKRLQGFAYMRITSRFGAIAKAETGHLILFFCRVHRRFSQMISSQ